MLFPQLSEEVILAYGINVLKESSGLVTCGVVANDLVSKVVVVVQNSLSLLSLSRYTLVAPFLFSKFDEWK